MARQVSTVVLAAWCWQLARGEARACPGGQGGTCDAGGEAVEDVGLLQARRAREEPQEEPGDAGLLAGGTDKYHPHFDTSPDYLHIAARAAGIGGNPGRLSDNYYLVIADAGGCDGGCGECCGTQRRVAEHMRRYVASRRARRPNSKLLFVLVGGDNFYWNGARSGRFHSTWLNVYGPELTGVPWFAALGNHDYGNDDPTVGCPDVRPRFVCDASNANTPACGGARPYSTERQGYNSNALNADKGGVDGDARRNWHQPDYTYYYSIPALNFELVTIDWNVEQFGAMGGNGFCWNCGAHGLMAHCGSVGALREAMTKVRDASTELLNNRSRAAESRNVAILSHYPTWFQRGINLRTKYLEGMPAEKRGSAKVLNFYGHTHVQSCDHKEGGECTDFLTGAAGGCCSSHDLPAGFVAISWDDAGAQSVECFLGGECTLHGYGRLAGEKNGSGVEEERERANLQEVCAHTEDDARCSKETSGNGS